MLGQSVDNGATFTSLLQTKQLCGPLGCMTDAAEYACNYEWPTWMQTFDIEGVCGAEPNPEGGPGTPDASTKPTKDAGPDAAMSNDDMGGGSSGCGCGTASLDAGGIGGLGALIGAMALMLRRRRSR